MTMKSHINEGQAGQTVVDINAMQVATAVRPAMTVAAPTRINQLSVNFGGPEGFDENLDANKLKIATEGSAAVDDLGFNIGDIFDKATEELVLPFGENMEIVPLHVQLGVVQAVDYDSGEDGKLYPTALAAEQDGLRRKQKSDKIKDGTWYHNVGFTKLLCKLKKDAEWSIPTFEAPSGAWYAEVIYEGWKPHETFNCMRKLYQTKRFGPFYSQAWELSVEKCAGEKRGNKQSYFYSPSVKKTTLPEEDMKWILNTMQGGAQ